MLQSNCAAPRSSNSNDFFCPGETIVKLCFKFLLPPTDGQYTLCATWSLLRKSTVVPRRITRVCGTKTIFFWSTDTCSVGDRISCRELRRCRRQYRRPTSIPSLLLFLARPPPAQALQSKACPVKSPQTRFSQSSSSQYLLSIAS